jgi:membrane protease subunit HflC
MQAYETGLKSSDSRIIVSPKSDFFRYFNSPTPAAPTSGDSTPETQTVK